MHSSRRPKLLIADTINYRPVSLLVFFGAVLFLILYTSALAQERLSPSAVEDLIRDVHPKRAAELIKQFGIDFDLTDELRLRFRKAGAGPEAMRELELAAIRCRLGQCGERPKADAAQDQRNRGQERTSHPKPDPLANKERFKSTEAAKDVEPKRGSLLAPEEKPRAGENREGEQKVVELPSQLQERADHVLRVENVSVTDGEVSGELVNISEQPVFGVQFQVLYSWRWANDYRPGGQDPGRAEYFTIDKEIRPGQRVPFNHRPSPPLPTRKDGSFDISVKIIGFNKIFS